MINPSAQTVGFVASLQSKCYTHAPSQAGKFWLLKASLATVSVSDPSVMKYWPLLALSVNMGWRTRGPAPAAWKSGED